MTEPDAMIAVSFPPGMNGDLKAEVVYDLGQELANGGLVRLNVKHDDTCPCVCGCRPMKDCTCTRVEIQVAG